MRVRSGISSAVCLQASNNDPPRLPALVFGNEVEGISDDVIGMADSAVEIPQFGTKHSFNISVCAGIVMYDIWTKTNK